MTKKKSIHNWSWLINIFLLVTILRIVRISDPDKSILLLITFYAILIILNLVVWIILKRNGNRYYTGYLGTAIGLLITLPLAILFTISQ